jgi:hypothetical protein
MIFFKAIPSCSCAWMPVLFPTVEALPAVPASYLEWPSSPLNLFPIFRMWSLEMILHGREEEEVIQSEIW